ncbi:MAG: (d)CMP kinase [Candidatus Contendobacter sp.]|nr:(d)CMP kinase [Candidatus Contendobacter sp.]
MNALAPVIAVDGPSGVGKGTLCRWLANRLGFHLLDSGALYRLTALAALRRNLALENEAEVAALAAGLAVEFLTETGGPSRILLDGTEVGPELRTETCGAAASRVAALPRVRAALLQRQRNFRRLPGLIADGRDMGTVVFPDAELKLFLTASAEERARRRHGQLSEQGVNANLKSLADEIAERDARDRQRATAPLRPAIDAEVLDTTYWSIAEVYERARALTIQRLGLPGNR